MAEKFGNIYFSSNSWNAPNFPSCTNAAAFQMFVFTKNFILGLL